MGKVIKLFLSGIAFVFSMNANADSFKLGYVDVAKIFATAKPAIEMQKVLKARFDPIQEELKKMNNSLVKLQTKIQDIQKTSPSIDKLSPTNRAMLEKLSLQYQKDHGVFQQKYMLFQQSLQKTQDYASALLLSKINVILKSISDKGNYDLVLTSNQMIYAKAKYDLTEQVIEELKSVNSSDLVKQLNDSEKVLNQQSATNKNIPN